MVFAPPSLNERRFLTRLSPDGLSSDTSRVERVLAYARVFLALTSLIAAKLQPLTSRPYTRVAIFLLLVYAVHSLVLLIWLLLKPSPGKRFLRWAQASDIMWPLLLSLFTRAPTSVFFIYFLFGLTATAFRWGFRETMFLAIASDVVLGLQAWVVATGPEFVRGLLFTDFERHRVVLRLGLLLLTGFLLGYLAEAEKELRAEIALTNRLLALTRFGRRFAEVMADVCRRFGRVFGGDQLVCVVSQLGTGRVFQWDIPLDDHSPARVREASPALRQSLMMAGYPHTFFAVQDSRGARFEAVDDEGRSIRSDTLRCLAMPLKADSVLSVRLQMGSEWHGRIVLINAELGINPERELRFAQNAMRQVAPALYSLFLYRRLRSRTGAAERARVARELHDTTIQSLIGIEMQMDVLRRQPGAEGNVAGELERIQGLLRQEIMNLRELMQSMRPVDIGPHQFLDFIAQLVERFRRDTGLNARFLSELHEVTLPAPVCQELARVVQEGLVNIRRHSHAKSAYVRFGAQNGHWQLIIDDDGQGFPFAGRMSLTELDDLHRGPTVIKERVRAIGGNMTVESNPGHGSRLEIIIPQKGHETYG